jgi:predicted RNA-binding Zn-ribbon protein involved in translation (DUF1610 family)
MSTALGQCKHFTGIYPDKRCRAGVEYAKVYGAPGPNSRAGFSRCWPCLSDGRHLPCALREMPTRAEILEAQAETERAMAAIEADLCPDCGGALTIRENDLVKVGRCEKCPGVGYRMCKDTAIDHGEVPDAE